METLTKAAEAVSHTLFGTGTGTHDQPQNPTTNEARQNTGNTESIPSAGSDHSIHSNKPISTTTNEISTLANDSPYYSNLSHGVDPPESSSYYTHAGGKDTRMSEEDVIAAAPRTLEGGQIDTFPHSSHHIESSTDSGRGAHQRFGVERLDDDGIRRNADDIEELSTSPEGRPRPRYIGNETDGDGIKRADGRDRVQFDSKDGSSGSLKPSLVAKVEDETELSKATHSGSSIVFKNLGDTSALTHGARIGTEQKNNAGTGLQDQRAQGNELGIAQVPQSGGLGSNAGRSTDITSHFRPVSSFNKSQQEFQKPPQKTSTEILEGRHEDKPAHQNLPSTFGNTKLSSTGVDDTTMPLSQESKPSPMTQTGGPSSANEPRSQGGIPNPATTNAIEPMGKGFTAGIGGPIEPSVGADPSSAAQPTQKQQGADRPMEEPAGQPAKGDPEKKEANQQLNEENKKAEAGHQYIKSTGLAAEGGDFDAARPGAGREADRLLEQHGVHREKQKNIPAADLAAAAKHPLTGKMHIKKLAHEAEGGKKHEDESHNKHGQGNTTSSEHKVNAVAEKTISGGGSANSGESMHNNEHSSNGSGHKSLSERIMEKIHFGHKE